MDNLSTGRSVSMTPGGQGGARTGANRVLRWAGMVMVLVSVLAVAAKVAFALTYVGPVTVTANMGSFSPNPVQINNAVTANLGANYYPPSGVPEGDLSAQYNWSVSQVQYKALQADTYGSPPADSYTDSISPTQPAASSGATLTCTPKIAGYWAVSVSCAVTVTDTQTSQYWSGSGNAGPKGLTSYTLDITYTGSVAGGSADDGTVVTNKITAVHAGWPIQLGANLSPSDLATKFTWTIGGAGGNGSTAINGYVRNAATGDPLVPGTDTSLYSMGIVVPLDPGADSKSTFPDPSSPGILKYYYYTKGGSLTASVNFQGGNAAKTTFSVAEYTETMQNSYTSGVVSTATQGGSVEMSLGPPLKYDQILFQQIPSSGDGAFAGTLHFVQIYTRNDEWIGDTTKGIPNWSTSETGLDGTYFYGNEAAPPSTIHTGDAPAHSSDNNYIKMVIDDTPAMWAMYEPKVSGSIVVPLAVQGWEWGGTETLNTTTGQWTLTSGVPIGPGTLSPLDPTNEYPVWSEISEAVRPPN